MEYIVGQGGYNTEQYKIHEHQSYEIIFYLSGYGTLMLDGNEMPVKKGNFVIVPPRVKHSSKSTEDLRYFSVIGNSDELLRLTAPAVFLDEDKGDGFALSKMILENKFGNKEYFSSLCRAYVLYVLKNVKINTDIEKAVYKIQRVISSNFCDPDYDVTKTLNDSGYAEDYIRYNFKKILGKTPVEFLTEMRIHNAVSLISVYQNSMSLFDIATNCGFDDYMYFSKKFKAITGVSPLEYKKSIVE